MFPAGVKSLTECFNKRTAAPVAAIALLALLVYSNTLHAPFVLDDVSNIVNNPAIKDFRYFAAPSKVKNLAVDPGVRSFFRTRLVGYFTLALNYRVHGLSPAGYHIVNLAVHIINGLLVYALVLLTFRTPRVPPDHRARDGIALFSALLFVCHPVQTQAVTYIVQRFASLATLFYLLTLVLYVKARLTMREAGERNPAADRNAEILSGRAIAWYAASLVSAVLAMETKEISFTLPAVIALYEFVFLEGERKKRLLYLAPLACTLAVIPLGLVDFDSGPGMTAAVANSVQKANISGIHVSDYLVTQFRVIVTYLRLLIFPVGQNLDYDYPVYRSFFQPAVFFSFLLLLGIGLAGAVLAYRSRGRADMRRLIAFGIFWFFMTLSVESSVIPIRDVIFEHRVYLPSAGFFPAAVTGVYLLYERLGRTAPRASRWITPAAIAVVLVFAVVAFARNAVWQSGVALWEDVARKSPGKARPHISLGLYYEQQGRLNDAIREYQAAIRLKPESVEAHNNLGVAYEKQGRFEPALREYETALRIQPDYLKARLNMGAAYEKRGMPREAERAYQSAYALRPDHPDVHYIRGKTCAAQGRYEDAIREYSAVIRLDPGHVDARNNLGNVYNALGRLDEAITEYRGAIGINPDFADAHYNLGIAYGKKGLFEDAVREFRTAIRLDPDHQDARYNLKITEEVMKRSKTR